MLKWLKTEYQTQKTTRLKNGKFTCTEDNLVIGWCTTEGTSLIVKRIGVSAWTLSLKILRVRSRLASRRCCIVTSTTILLWTKGLTRAAASRNLPIRTINRKFWRTNAVQIHHTSCFFAALIRRQNKQRQVVAIKKTNIKKIKSSIVNLELCHRHRTRASWYCWTFYFARAAVACDAGESSCIIFSAMCATPKTTSPIIRGCCFLPVLLSKGKTRWDRWGDIKERSWIICWLYSWPYSESCLILLKLLKHKITA